MAAPQDSSRRPQPTATESEAVHAVDEFTGKAEMTQRIRRKSSGTGCDDVCCLDSRFQHAGESVTTVNSYEQISELLTECVLKGEVNMDLQEQLV